MNGIIDIGETCDLINRPVVTVDSKGIIYYINNTAEKYFATSRESACGKEQTDIIEIIDTAEGNKVQLFDGAGNAAKDGEGVLYVGGIVEYYIKFKSRKYVTTDNDECYWVFVFEDISNEIEMQKQLKHKRRLEVLSDLAVGVAHDINNTLGGIIGCSEILSMELGGNERLDKLSNKIIQSANCAAELNQKLLRFSAATEPTFELINIHDLLNETIGILQNSLGNQIQITSDFVGDEVIVYADRAELEVVLINIALNAQDAISGDGAMLFSTMVVDNTMKQLKVKSFELKANYYLKVSITDNGRGICDDLLKEEFDSSHTAGAIRNIERAGFATVCDIMKHNQGGVEVISEFGVKSQFNLYLPLAKEENNLEFGVDLSSEELFEGLQIEQYSDKKVVLLVDDNDMVRISMREVLESLGCGVLEAVNGEEGVRLFKENIAKVDLIILDVIMPVMDGKEALEEIRKVSTDVKVIIASGYMNQLSQSVFLEFGANGFLTKPFNINELKKVIIDSAQKGNIGFDVGDNTVNASMQRVHSQDETSSNMKVVREGYSDVIELLLIEGNENIRELMHEILYDGGFHVTAFEDIEHAKKAILSGKYFSLAIIDIDCIEKQDNELFMLLRNTDDGRPRYVIASSGKDLESVAHKALRLGVDDFLVKPFSLNFMKIRLEVARKYLENEQMKNKMQAMLRENQERMALAIDGAGIGMWDWKINEKEFYASDKCKELFGYVEGSNIGVLDYLHSITVKEDQVVLAKEFSQYLREPVGILNVDFRINHSEKGCIWISSIAKMFYDREGGKSKRLIGISMDVTERKTEETVLREESQRLEEMVAQRTKELLRSNEKLSEEIEAREVAELKNMEHQLKLMDSDKLASLGILVSGIGHEINNPIQFIMFNLPFVKNAWESVLPILDDYYKEHPEFELRGIPYELARDRLPNMANDIMEGAERISSIVKELREYSRQSRNEEFKDEDIVEVVLSAKSLFSKYMGKSVNDVGLHTPSEQIIATVNRTRIEQVIINLLQNAALALEDSEKKEISIDIKCSGDKDMIEIMVSDTGCGIKEVHMKHLTDPFFTTRSSEGGTGLGLAMCKKIVHDHFGDITFHSQEGVGTTVIVSLPIKCEDK